MFFNSAFMPRVSFREIVLLDLIISGHSPAQVSLMLACAAPEMAQLAAEYRIQHSEGDQTEMKQVGSQQHAS